MSNNKIKLGKFGEEIAGKYLINKGYKIITKNFQTREGEIDIICRKDQVIIFVEVKTRRNKLFGWPEESVTDEKLDKIINTAEIYLDQEKINLPWRIDIISIMFKQNNPTINHLIDVRRT